MPQQQKNFNRLIHWNLYYHLKAIHTFCSWIKCDAKKDKTDDYNARASFFIFISYQFDEKK